MSWIKSFIFPTTKLQVCRYFTNSMFIPPQLIFQSLNRCVMLYDIMSSKKILYKIILNIARALSCITNNTWKLQWIGMFIVNTWLIMLNLYNAQRLVIAITLVGAQQTSRIIIDLYNPFHSCFFSYKVLYKNLTLLKISYWKIYVCVSPKGTAHWTHQKHLAYEASLWQCVRFMFPNK